MFPIAISLSPNAEREDLWRALFLLLRPWGWIRYYSVIASAAKQSRGLASTDGIASSVAPHPPRNDVETLEEEFKKYFDVPYAWSFNSGRSALYTLLKALGIGPGDDVFLQAFTCNAVPNPVLWVGARPVYVDIERDTYNIDPDDLQKKITPRAKALIIQHTFGIPADLERILPIARAHNLFVIEDCAHALGATTQNQISNIKNQKDISKIKNNEARHSEGTTATEASRKIGTFGDAAFFSFGRDKVISSVYGGMLITKNPALAQKIEAEYQKLPYPSHFWVFQQLLHPVIFALALPVYNFLGLGKFIIRLAQTLRLLSRAVTAGERSGVRPHSMPARLPEALAALALGQFQRLERFNEHRRKIVSYYLSQLRSSSFHLPLSCHPERSEGSPVWLRFPIQHPRAAEILKAARKRGIYLGDWYREIIAPAGTDLAKMGYQQGSCPVAEEVAACVINLPTYPRLYLQEAEKVIRLIGL